jgi:magnesium-protoporphyrin O-methyltransferase
MTSCQCQGIEIEFNRQEAARKLRAYRKRGPAGTTRRLIELLLGWGVKGQTLLDVGGGIGVIQYELLRAGARTAMSVEASPAYAAAARKEAARQGLLDQIEFHQGDFVELADRLPPADIVTLDRVICCYHDMASLVGRSADHARRLYGVVYPRDTAWVRLALQVENLLHRMKGSPFRAFVHPTAAVEATLLKRGFRRHTHQPAGVWQVVVYTR